MSITNTVLVFLVTPVLIIMLIAGLSLAGSSRRRAKRYRPGRPYDFTPMWFLSSPAQVGSPDPVMQPAGSSAVAGRGHQPALEAGVDGGGAAAGSGAAGLGARPASQGATGGASDRW